MTDDSNKPGGPGPDDLQTPFLFVPHGAPEPVEWMRKHPGWVKFPATFVPRAPSAVRTIPGTNRPWPLDKRGQPWPRSRFGQPLRPLDEYPPGVRAPGEAYHGPIADPDKAVRGYMDFMAERGGLGRFDADPYAPIKAYLSAKDVWENPGKYAGYARPEAAPVPALAPSLAEAGADAIRAVTDRTCVAGTEKAAASGTGRSESGDFRGDLHNLIGEDGLAQFDALPAAEQNRVIAEVGPNLVAARKSVALAAYSGGASGTSSLPVLTASNTPGLLMTDAIGAPVLDAVKRLYPVIEDQSPKFKELFAGCSPTRPHYHQYEFYSYIGEIGPGASPQAAFQELLKNAVPGGNRTGTPIENLDPSTATFAGRGGTVVTLVESESLSIFNVTQPDHILHDGFVQRQIVVKGNSMYIRTIGVGNNTSDDLAWANEVAAIPAFAGSTATIRHALYPPPPSTGD